MNNKPFKPFSSLLTLQRISLIALIFSIQGRYASAQYFERVYPGLNMSSVAGLDNTLDSGFIICGTQVGGFLLKIKPDGDIEWTSRDSGNVLQSAAVIQNTLGNFVVIGSCNSGQYSSEAVVATYDAAGDPLTHFRIPPMDGWGSWGTTIARSPDRLLDRYCYYVDGFTSDNAYYLDNQDKIAGDMTTVGLNSISMDNAGNYYAAGNLAFDMDSLFNWRDNVLVLSSNHFLRSEYFFDTNISSAGISSDGGVMLAGLYDSLGTKFLRLIKLDANGSLLWEKYIADSELITVNQVAQTNDGGFAILSAGDNGNNLYIAFLKVDDSGNQSWKQIYSGNGASVPKNFVQLEDGYAILGSSLGDPHLIRTDHSGSTNTTSIATVFAQSNQIRIYPNPSDGFINLSFEKPLDKSQNISVLDLTGREVFRQQIAENHCKLDLSFLARGVYQIRFTASDAEPISGRFVIE